MKHFYKKLLTALPLVAIAQIGSAQCPDCGTGVDGAYTASTNTTIAGGTYNFTSFTIDPSVTVTATGTAPLVIRCTGNVVINGTLTVKGGNGTNGITSDTNGVGGIGVAGGYNGGNGVYSSTVGPLPGVAGSGPGGSSNGGGAWSGGGGAGYATAGDSSGNAGGGFGGPAYGNAMLSSVDGGSGGGGGAGGYSCGGGGGGAGGGIILITSCGSITINAGGIINANGGNGGSDGTGNCGGGGGGSGGTVWLSGITVTNNGMISSVGGSGGASTVPGIPYYGGGAMGADGRIRIDGTLNGTGTITPANGYNGQLLNVLISNTNESCNGSNDATATVSVLSGNSPYTYAWTPVGGTGPAATGIPAGTYSCTVTDATGCSMTVTCNVTEPPVLAAVAMQLNNPTCFGDCNGTATIVASGGTPSYTFQWSNGNTSMSSNSLCAGSYTVNVTDANGCVTTVTFTLTDPPPIISTITSFDVTCNGACDGSVAESPQGGTAPYTYLWTPGGITTPTAGNLCAGCYTVTVTDANGCTTTDTVCLTQPTVLVASATTTPSSGSNGTGSGTGSGGTAPYNYNWQPGNINTANATGLAPGNYTLTVTDANGCMDTTVVTVLLDGIDPHSLSAEGVNVYPNPASYEINIHITQQVDLFIYDPVGKLISSQQLKEGDNTVNVSALADGIYSFRFTADGASLTKKITVAH